MTGLRIGAHPANRIMNERNTANRITFVTDVVFIKLKIFTISAVVFVVVKYSDVVFAHVFRNVEPNRSFL